MIDGNTYALNKYLDKQERQEKMLEALIDEIKPQVQEIRDIVIDIAENVRSIEYDTGYDFSQEILELIQEKVQI